MPRTLYRSVLVVLLACCCVAAVTAQVASDVTSADSAGLRLDVYAAAYRGTNLEESALIGAEIRGLARTTTRGRRLRVTYSVAGGAPGAEQVTEVPLDNDTPGSDRDAVVRVLRRLTLMAGTYRVTVAVRDSQDGRTVSATHDVEVPAYGAAPAVIAVSNVMITSSAVGGYTHADANEEYRLQPILAQPPSARRQFSRGEKVEVLAEVYELPPDTDLGGSMTVWTRIRRGDADGPIVFDTSDIGASETFSDGRWGYQHWQLVPVRDLEPGNYVLQVGAQAADGMYEAWRSVPIAIVP